MKRAIILIIIVVSLCFTANASSKEENPPVTTQFNLARGLGKATIFLNARPFKGASGKGFYKVSIDRYAPFFVTRNSDTTIDLDLGTHSIQITAVIGSVPSLTEPVFGKSSELNFELAQGELLTLEYVGPNRAVDKGKLTRR